jgi:hypothetical protein
MRLPLTNTSAAKGAAPLPSKTRVLTKRIMRSPYAPPLANQANGAF